MDDKALSRRLAACFAGGAITALIAVTFQVGVAGIMAAAAVGAAFGYLSYRPGDVWAAVRRHVPEAVHWMWRFGTSPFTYAFALTGMLALSPIVLLVVVWWHQLPLAQTFSLVDRIWVHAIAASVQILAYVVGEALVMKGVPSLRGSDYGEGTEHLVLPLPRRLRVWQHYRAVSHDGLDPHALYLMDVGWGETFRMAWDVAIVPTVRWWVRVPRTVVRETFSFFRLVFRAIHCEERVARMVDGPIGGVVAYVGAVLAFGPAFHEAGALAKLGVVLAGGVLGLVFAALGHALAKRMAYPREA